MYRGWGGLFIMLPKVWQTIDESPLKLPDARMPSGSFGQMAFVPIEQTKVH